MSKKPPTLVQFNYSEPSKTLEEEMSETAEPCDATNGGQEDPPLPESVIDTLVEDVKDDLGEIVEQEIEDSLDLRSSNQRDAEPIKVVGKPDIDEKAIFSNFPDNLAVVPDNLKEVISDKPIKPIKQKKARKPMTEEHKAKLALAREKAMASRKAKAEERKKMKELEKQEKELVKQQKVKRVQKLKEEVEGEDATTTQSNIKTNVSGLTRKDLEEAQLDAIMKYEAMRKERKAKKKQEQAIEAEKQKMLNTIQRATGTYGYRGRDANGRLLNRFDSCY
jgi:hypothetical protein